MTRAETKGRRFVALVLVFGIVVPSFVAIGGMALWWRRSGRDDQLERGLKAYAAGDWRSAENAARERLAVRRDDVDARRLLIRSWFRQGRDKPALSMQSRLPLESLTAEDCFLWGQAAARQGQREIGIVLWRRALGLDERHVETIVALEHALEELDILHEAELAAERLARQPGWEARAALMLGRVRAKQSDPGGAAEALGRALERPDEWHGADRPDRVRKRLARFLLESGRPEDARAALAPLARDVPADDPETCWLLGRCDLQQGTEPALTVAEAALSYRDDHPLEPEPAPFIGETRCGACHAAIFRSQHRSRHARTFFRKEQFAALPLSDRPVVDPADPSVTHEFTRRGEQVAVRSHVGDRVLETIIEYALGSGDRGLTLLGRDPAGRPYECRLSHYPAPVGWDVTTGQPRNAAGPGSYRGARINADAVRRCLGCHTTNARSVLNNTGPEAADAAIGCERCHGPGGHHIKALDRAAAPNAGKNNGAGADLEDLAIARPTLADAPAIVALCAQCHSPRDPNFAVTRGDPGAARFQGTTFAWSRCYTESRGRFHCTTCHNPHRDVETSASYYEARCLECHAGPDALAAPAHAHAGPRRQRAELQPGPGRPCPIQPDRGCIECHMPKVPIPMAHARFTDHFIRPHYDERKNGGDEHEKKTPPDPSP